MRSWHSGACAIDFKVIVVNRRIVFLYIYMYNHTLNAKTIKMPIRQWKGHQALWKAGPLLGVKM